MDGAGPYVARFTPTRVGRWALTTSYSGDDANTSAALTCGSTVIAVTQAIPTLTPVSIPTTASAGDTLGASVWLNGGYQPAGRVQFRLFDPADPACAGVPTYVEEADLSDSAAATATGFTVPKESEGTWNWTVTYLGDENNAAIGSQCGQSPASVEKKGLIRSPRPRSRSRRTCTSTA